jgi:hypothetical protein
MAAAPETSGNDTNSAYDARFRAEERRAVIDLAAWIGHSAVPEHIRKAAPAAAVAVAPVAQRLDCHVEVIWLSWHVCEIAPLYPGWHRPGHVWQLTTTEIALMAKVKEALRAVTAATTTSLPPAVFRSTLTGPATKPLLPS